MMEPLEYKRCVSDLKQMMAVDLSFLIWKMELLITCILNYEN